MSTAAAPSSAATTTATTGVGLGYGIAIAVSILVLISTIMLASYACVRIKANDRRGTYYSNNHNDNHNRENITHDSGGPVIVMGLEKSMVDAYPKMVIGESRRLPKPNEGPCAICLSEYLPQETIRCVPDCHHCFHVECVDEWLRTSATCPLCRNSPAPTPAATPLSELVPLAFHAR
ncbi:putative RING-H2 finger protein ATL69 [Abrus precatorius]|uniref:RING-H2 finger protein ATL69 n=1 Tax=Abrus precatorius TaxID=3816 RepID=A0A8B8KJU5_ABRPR|nr:putative RING-H2 finger protein ATL69 [Abrus precatorius]